jgi:hypothetical protein
VRREAKTGWPGCSWPLTTQKRTFHNTRSYLWNPSRADIIAGINHAWLSVMDQSHSWKKGFARSGQPVQRHSTIGSKRINRKSI